MNIGRVALLAIVSVLRTIVLDYIPALLGGEMRRYPIPHGIDGRQDDRDNLRAQGADGEICALAAAVVRHAPDGQATILSRLATSHETLVTFMAEEGLVYATLFWRDGRIEVETTAPGRIEQWGDRLEWYEAGLDEEAVRALVGQPLSSVGLLAFDVDCIIVESSPLVRGGAKLQIDRKRSLVNCATGQIWDR